MPKYLNQFLEAVKVEQRKVVRETIKNNIMKDEKDDKKIRNKES